MMVKPGGYLRHSQKGNLLIICSFNAKSKSKIDWHGHLPIDLLSQHWWDRLWHWCRAMPTSKRRLWLFWKVFEAKSELLMSFACWAGPVRKNFIGGFSNAFSISRVACWLGENWGSRIWCLLCRVSAALRLWCGCRVEEGFSPQWSLCFVGSISYRGGGDTGPCTGWGMP